MPSKQTGQCSPSLLVQLAGHLPTPHLTAGTALLGSRPSPSHASQPARHQESRPFQPCAAPAGESASGSQKREKSLAARCQPVPKLTTLLVPDASSAEKQGIPSSKGVLDLRTRPCEATFQLHNPQSLHLFNSLPIPLFMKQDNNLPQGAATGSHGIMCVDAFAEIGCKIDTKSNITFYPGFIYSLNKNLLSTLHVSGTVLGAGDHVGDKQNKIPPSQCLYSRACASPECRWQTVQQRGRLGELLLWL